MRRHLSRCSGLNSLLLGRSLLLSSRGLLLQWLEDGGPELALLAECVAHIQTLHASLVITGHSLKGRDDAIKSPCLTDSLRSTSFKLDMHNMDVEMIVGRLIVDIAL